MADDLPWRAPPRAWARCARAGLWCALAFASAARAAPPSGEVAAASEVPVTPPRLLQQVVLDYPEEALASGQHGDVTLEVSVDAQGNVVEARVVSGPELFHAVALDAASQLRFEPARRGGEAVPAKLRVSFHVAPPELRDADDATAAPIEVVVRAPVATAQWTRPETRLGTRDLDQRAGRGLAEVIGEVPGVVVAGGTADVAKPIVRGQTERRLLLLHDGVRHEGQKWSPDHGPEVDPFAAGEVRVVRGAAGVPFGADAIGGVILVDPPALRDTAGVGGRARLGFSSNGLAPYGALRLDVVPAAADALTLRAEGSYRRSAALTSPRYVLGNTASETWSAGAAVGYRWDAGSVRARWHRSAQRSGVFYGVRADSPSDFADGLQADRPVTADQWTVSYGIDRAYQQATHDLVSVHADLRAGDVGRVTAIYAYQHNRRLEFAQVRLSEVAGAQYDFTLRTHTLDLAFHHDRRELGATTLEGSVGISGFFQENVYEGWSLIPNYRDLGLSVHAMERLRWRRGAVELGARYDHLTRNAFVFPRDYERHVSRGTLDAERCEERETVARCPSVWHTGSVALGGVVHAVPDRFDIKLDLSSASRFPDVDELYLTGAAPSLPVYALGDPDLRVETAWSASPTLSLRHPWVEGEVSGFASFVRNHVYFAPQIGPSGAPAFDVTIEGTYPRYTYRAVDAWTAGLDGYLSVAPDWWLGLDIAGALVRMADVSTGEQLVGTPSDRLRLTLTGRPPGRGPVSEPYVRATTELVARQGLVDPSRDFAPAPDGYVLLGLAAGLAVDAGRTRLRIDLEVHNLLNQAYREYTSLLRYYADQPGRDVRLRLAADF